MNPSLSDAQIAVLEALADGPKSMRELGIVADDALALQREGVIALDPDRWPGEYVPGNPLIARLPDDERPWPGWDRWNT